MRERQEEKKASRLKTYLVVKLICLYIYVDE